MKNKYLLNILRIGGILFAIELVCFVIIAYYSMGDEPVPNGVQIFSKWFLPIGGFPLALINSDWPLYAKSLWLMVTLFILNLIIQSHLMYLIIRVIKK